MDEQPDQGDAEPAVHPVNDTKPVRWKHVAAAQRKIGARQSRSCVTDVPTESELEEKDGERDTCETRRLRYRSQGGRCPESGCQQQEAAQDQQRVDEVGGADQVWQSEQHRDAPERDLQTEQDEEPERDPSHW